MLALILTVSICVSFFPAFAFADEEDPLPRETENEETGRIEEDLPLKTEEDFLEEGIFDATRAYEYYLTLTEEEQGAFLKSLSEENAQLLKELIAQDAETQPVLQAEASETGQVTPAQAEIQSDEEPEQGSQDEQNISGTDKEEEDPEKIEFELMKKLPKEHWILYNIQIISFGRNICFARSPKCSECFLYDLCKSKDKRDK